MGTLRQGVAAEPLLAKAYLKFVANLHCNSTCVVREVILRCGPHSGTPERPQKPHGMGPIICPFEDQLGDPNTGMNLKGRYTHLFFQCVFRNTAHPFEYMHTNVRTPVLRSPTTEMTSSNYLITVFQSELLASFPTNQSWLS